MQFPAANAPIDATTPKASANLLSIPWAAFRSKMWAWWKILNTRTKTYRIRVSLNAHHSCNGVAFDVLMFLYNIFSLSLTKEGASTDGGSKEGVLWCFGST